jgi:hypothetical protein
MHWTRTYGSAACECAGNMALSSCKLKQAARTAKSIHSQRLVTGNAGEPRLRDSPIKRRYRGARAYAAIDATDSLGGFCRRDICRISCRRSAQPRCVTLFRAPHLLILNEPPQLDKRISAIEEKVRKFHDLISRIDKALAEPAVYIEDPAKVALLSSQRGELERMLVAAEDEWLSLAGDLAAAREG